MYPFGKYVEKVSPRLASITLIMTEILNNDRIYGW